ncbi:MAG: methyltransferase type 11 [Magnetovibrio sp.]|nr:methyltransferase type 11 [Magnetovibrio sp.]
MWRDVIDIRDFYETPLGHQSQRFINTQLARLWPDIKGQNVLGLGYAIPYLTDFLNNAARVVTTMPAKQGVLRWPPQGGSLTALVDDLNLPFQDLSFDRVILIHALEYAEQTRPLLREVWRILAGSGRLIVVVPNRRGLWARFEHTPFGHGLPYSGRQLSHALRDNMFTPINISRALVMPPFRSRMVQSVSSPCESISTRHFPILGGIIIAEATKQIYAGTSVNSTSRMRQYVPFPKQSP